jgi:hypothetical protein
MPRSRLLDLLDNSAARRPIYRVRLRPEKNVDAVRALRNGLKRPLRDHGLRAISIEEERP